MQPPRTLQNWLSEAPFTLALSSSFFGFYAHCGVVAALFEAGLQVKKVTGSSAGALIAGGLASGLGPLELRDRLFEVRRHDFWDPRPGLGFLRGAKFLSRLSEMFVPTFSEAKIPIAVAAVDVLSLKTYFLDSGSLPKAVAASCAVPFLFHPVRIGGRFYTDGGVFNKAGVDPADGNEKLLNIFFESQGIMGVYERKTSLPRVNDQQKILRFRNLPRVNFYTLAEGPDAFQNGYERMQAALQQPLSASALAEA